MSNNIFKILQKKKDQILEVWIKTQINSPDLRDELISNEDLRTSCEELINNLMSSLNEENINDPHSPDFDSVNEILAGISFSQAKKGFNPRETAFFVIGLKEALIHVLQQEVSDPQILFSESLKLTRLMDNFSIITFETFIRGREEVILRQTDEISEISTPVIRVWDGILALPIIGTLDSSRTQVVMENLLQEIVETGSSIAILDISGVPAVDSLVAQHLMKTVSATRLMGAECIISGIRPEIAQTIVHLGIDLSNIVTKATLASALKFAFRSMKLEVKTVVAKENKNS